MTTDMNFICLGVARITEAYMNEEPQLMGAGCSKWILSFAIVAICSVTIPCAVPIAVIFVTRIILARS
jgi:hypothetical protein